MSATTDTAHTAQQVVLVTGASSGFGRLTAETLARSGHTVVAGMRATEGRNAPNVAQLEELAAAEGVSIGSVELDVQDEASVSAGVADVIARHGRLDVVVHNAGHMMLGPTEAFTPGQLAELYDVNVLGTQRVNRAVLPHLRERRSGLLVWVGSSSTRGGHPPFLAPYFAAKAGMDTLAESYAAELVRFGIDTTIVVPGAFPSGTNHFAHSGTPDDADVERAYDADYGRLRSEMPERLSALFPADVDAEAAAQSVADEIARVVGLPAGQRPFRTHVDPSRDGSEVVSAVYDRIRAEFFRRIGAEDLLTPLASL